MHACICSLLPLLLYVECLHWQCHFDSNTNLALPMPVITCFSKFDTQSMMGYIVSDCTVLIVKTICISKCALQCTEGFAAVIWSWICARRLSALNPPSCTGLDSSIVTECFPKYWSLTCCLTHLNVPGKVSLLPVLVLSTCCRDYSLHWTHSLGWAFTYYGS